MQNRNYGRKTDSGGIEYAPRKFIEDGNIIVPRIDDDEAYVSRGWYKVIDQVPQYDPEKYTAALVGWTVDETAKTVMAIYEIQPIPPSPTKQVKRFSKLKLTLFCMDQKLWNYIKKFLIKTGYYDLFVMAQYFLESDEYFQRGIDSFKTEFISMGHTEEEFEAMKESMFAFSFDGYETIDVIPPNEQEEMEENQADELSGMQELSGDNNLSAETELLGEA